MCNNERRQIVMFSAVLLMPKSSVLSAHDPSPTVVVGDASKMGCQLVADMIRRRNHFQVAGSATTCDDLISAVIRLQPDITVIGSQLEDGPSAGLLALRELRALPEPPRVIMLLDPEQSELGVEAFRNGARGVFCRTGASTELHKCMQCVYKGQIWANNAQLENIVETLRLAPVPMLYKPPITAPLSQREEQVARLVASGLSNHEIAHKLSLSHHTVKNYLFRVFEKLSISTRIELVLYILSQGKGLESEENAIADTTFKMRA